jgi:hypothetical protein
VVRLWFAAAVIVLAAALQADAGYTFVYPVGGETFVVGDTITIRWTATSDQYQCRIQVTVDDGLTLSTIPNSSVSVTDSASWGHFRWVIPDSMDGTTLVSSQCRLFIKPYNPDPVANDTTGTFTILDGTRAVYARWSDKKDGCGSGAGMALIPPIWFWASGKRSRRR